MILYRGQKFEITIPNSNTKKPFTCNFMLIGDNNNLSIVHLDTKYQGYVKWDNLQLEVGHVGITIDKLKEFFIWYYNNTEFDINSFKLTE